MSTEGRQYGGQFIRRRQTVIRKALSWTPRGAVSTSGKVEGQRRSRRENRVSLYWISTELPVRNNFVKICRKQVSHAGGTQKRSHSVSLLIKKICVLGRKCSFLPRMVLKPHSKSYICALDVIHIICFPIIS